MTKGIHFNSRLVMRRLCFIFVMLMCSLALSVTALCKDQENAKRPSEAKTASSEPVTAYHTEIKKGAESANWVSWLAIASTFGVIIPLWFLLWKGQRSILEKFDSRAQFRGSSSFQSNRGITIGDLEKEGRRIGAEVVMQVSSLKTAVANGLDSSGIVGGLANCKETVEGLSRRIEYLRQSCAGIEEVDAAVQGIGNRLKELIDKHPALVDLAIKDAVALLQECQNQGIFTVDQLRNRCQAADAYAQASEQVKDYGQRLNETIRELEERNKCNDDLRKSLDYLYGSADFKPVQDALQQAMAGQPDAIQSAVTTQLLQFYLYSAVFSNVPSQIKSAFVRMDDSLYELMGEDRQETLQAVRKAVVGFINNDILHRFGTPYSVSWPELNGMASAHEDWYSRENNIGNCICKVRSALIFNNGQIMSRAIIQTRI